MAKQEIIKPLKDLLAECLQFNIEELVSRTDWGDDQFRGIARRPRSNFRNQQAI